jgi:hypothetical protein
LTSLRQQTYDPTTQKAKYLSVQELHQRYQFLLIEIKSDTPPADIPQLDQLFVQAVSEDDLQKKLLTHLELMAQAIVAMGMASDSLQEDMPFTGASIVEEALQQSSGMRIPIKCFGCDGIPKYTENAFHLWRNCPNKADKQVWENFQKNLKEFRERKQARQEQKRNQGGGSQYGNYGPHTMTNDPTNWERQRFPSKKVQEQIQAIADDKNTPHTRMNL